MKLIRYLNKRETVGFAALQPDGSVIQVVGGIYESPNLTGEKAGVVKLLAPIEPTTIICVGLNYQRRAQETGAQFPHTPVYMHQCNIRGASIVRPLPWTTSITMDPEGPEFLVCAHFWLLYRDA